MMPHRFDHALIVLRDLRRSRSDLLLPGKARQPEELKALDHISNAIQEVMAAQRLFANRALLEASNRNLITDALQQIDWFKTAAHRPRPSPPAALRAEE
jgi:hypothetical protein